MKYTLAIALILSSATMAEANKARPGVPSPQQTQALNTINAAKAAGATTTVVATPSGSQVTIHYADGTTQTVNLN